MNIKCKAITPLCLRVNNYKSARNRLSCRRVKIYRPPSLDACCTRPIFLIVVREWNSAKRRDHVLVVNFQFYLMVEGC